MYSLMTVNKALTNKYDKRMFLLKYRMVIDSIIARDLRSYLSLTYTNSGLPVAVTKWKY